MVELLSEHKGVVALLLLAVTFIVFLLERYPPAVVAIVSASVYLLLGHIDTRDVLAVFSNSAPLTIAAMFILSGALVRTGALESAAQMINSLSQRRPRMTVVSFFLGATAASALTNNTPIVAVLIPVVRRLARAMGLAPTLLLIPLSYAVILGGTCTLIGTSTNLLVDGVARAAGLRAFSIFEITPVGLVAAATVLSTVLLLARWLLPSRASAAELADQQGLALDMTELTVHPRAPVEGKSVGSVRALTRPGIEVVAVERDGCIAPSEPGSHLLAAGDRIIVRATMPEVLTLHTDPDFGTLSTIDTNAASKRTIIVEAVLAPSVFGTPRQGIVDIGLQRFRNRLVVPCLRAYCAAGQNCPSDALSIARPTRPPTGH